MRIRPEWVNLDFQVKLDLEGNGRSLHNIIIGTFTKVVCIFGPNFVILA